MDHITSHFNNMFVNNKQTPIANETMKRMFLQVLVGIYVKLYTHLGVDVACCFFKQCTLHVNNSILHHHTLQWGNIVAHSGRVVVGNKLFAPVLTLSFPC